MDGATIENADIMAKNGVIQIIDEVLIPGVAPNSTAIPHGSSSSSHSPVQVNAASKSSIVGVGILALLALAFL